MTLLALAIIGGMIGNVLIATVLFVLRERKERRDAAAPEWIRLPRHRSPLVRFWRSWGI